MVKGNINFVNFIKIIYINVEYISNRYWFLLLIINYMYIVFYSDICFKVYNIIFIGNLEWN